jgi:hypothetical protein
MIIADMLTASEWCMSSQTVVAMLARRSRLKSQKLERRGYIEDMKLRRNQTRLQVVGKNEICGVNDVRNVQ